ncbi:MAG: septum formation protein Maf [Lachnospiraceae bacterium]|nr:septum formation protein Maf [Lachnospiraceae bacterium]
MQNKKIILASASPRRRELLTQAGYEFEIQVSHKEETYTSETPDEIVKELALLKAKDIAEHNDAKNMIVIGADTVVAHKGAILGKPKSKDDAYELIKGFQGDKHQVYTGVAILDYDIDGKETIVNHAVKTDVYVNPMTDEEIWNYIQSDNVMDKAGSYGIQSGFAVHIEKIEGDYFNVVGLPVSYIYQMLNKLS